jgi:NHLM bacteriocin system ABC transporter ATP-binding protein
MTKTQSNLTMLGSEGERRQVAGNNPLLLDDPTEFWIVCSGRVDVFVVPFRNGEQTGARVHIFRTEPGQMLFGSHSDSQNSDSQNSETQSGIVLMAVGIPGSEVVRLTQSQFQELAADPEWADQLSVALDAWIAGLTASVARDRMPSRAVLLNARKDAPVTAETVVSSDQGVSWVCETEGTFQFLGKTEFSLNASTECFPLSSPGWLTARAAATLKVVETESILRDSRLWSGLKLFHQVVSSRAAGEMDDVAAAERDRLQRKTKSENRLIQATLTELAAVVESDDAGESLAAAGQDPLFAACRLVGAEMGIAMRPPRDNGERTRRDPVNAIARASGIRMRQVLLAGDWWRQDNGPLLAFQGDNHPVAVLPKSASSYELADPVTQSRTLLTGTNASELQGFGYSFYRSFPAHALSTRDVLRFGLAGTRRDWLAVVLLGLAGGLLGLLVPIAIASIFGRIIPGAERDQLLLLVMILMVSAVVAALFEFTQGIAMLRVETRTDYAVETGVWDRLLNLPTSFFRQYSSGDLAERAMGIARIRQQLTEAAMSSLLTFVFSLVSFGLLAYYDLRLTVLAMVFFLVIVAATCVTAMIQLRYERQNYHVRGRVMGRVLQLLTGISRLRVAGAENRALAFWAKDFALQTKLGFRAQSVANNLESFMASVPVLASMAIFATVVLAPRESLSLGVFLAFNAAFVQIIFAAISMSSTITSVLEIVPLYERAKPILETLPEFDRTKRDPGDLRGEIEISHVSFGYDAEGPLVLDDVSIHIQPGEFVAFVGPSGAGKSMILRLLLGFEIPTTGSIYYDREDLAGLDHQSVRRQIGVVLQNSQLTPGEILSNIVGTSGYTVEDAWEAARLSGFADDIERMPMGMYTVITEGESTLSGGQRQRLLIARAIVSKPPILLFDEATSALDNVTQAMVAESLEGLKSTRIVVAHRLSTVMNADRICVIDRGKVVQQGRYDDLIQQPGLFADLAKRQLL